MSCTNGSGCTKESPFGSSVYAGASTAGDYAYLVVVDNVIYEQRVVFSGDPREAAGEGR